MRAGKVSTMKAVALGVAVMFIVASCGSSDSASGGRTKNAALCFATQEDKDAAIKTAQDELDAANATTSSGASGGYRRPAVGPISGTFSSGTVVPPTDAPITTDAPAPTDAPATPVEDSGPNISMLEQALLVAQDQPVCAAEDAGAAPALQTIDCPVTIKGLSTPGYVSLIACDAVTRIESTRGNYGGVTQGSNSTIWMYGFDEMEWRIYVGDTNIASGLYNVSDGEVTVNAQYQVAAPPSEDTNTTVDGSSDSTTPGVTPNCTVMFTSTGMSWDCPNGERFNAAFEDMSNPGFYSTVECASSGSFTVAEGQEFQYNFALGGIFTAGNNAYVTKT